MVKKFITQEGLEKLKQKLEYLKTVERKEIASRIKKLIDQGDIIENPAYDQAQNELQEAEGRIQQLENTIKNLVVSTTKEKDAVGLGSKVTLKFDGSIIKYTIVGFDEADLTQNKISYESPIGKALMKHQRGEVVEVQTPKGTVMYKIISVE
jgi:transcription elongation factor GreA